MSPEQFAYWFQGFAELSPTPPTQEQWESIREHLALVFKKVTPPVKLAPTIPPATPDQKKASGDLQRLIREYEETARKADRISPWMPDHLWPSLPPKYHGPYDLKPGTLIC